MYECFDVPPTDPKRFRIEILLSTGVGMDPFKRKAGGDTPPLFTSTASCIGLPLVNFLAQPEPFWVFHSSTFELNLSSSCHEVPHADPSNPQNMLTSRRKVEVCKPLEQGDIRVRQGRNMDDQERARGDVESERRRPPGQRGQRRPVR
jgi:hypothetical protein